MREFLGAPEVLEAPMATENLDRETWALQLWAPFLEASDNGQEFFILDFVIDFSSSQLLREIGDETEDTIGTML